MGWKIILLEKEDSFGESLLKYFDKQKGLGRLGDWSFCHIKDEMELAKETKGSIFFLIGRGFSEKSILEALHENGESEERSWAYGELKEEAEQPFYRFGGVERLLQDIQERTEGKRVSSGKNVPAMLIGSVNMLGMVGNEVFLEAISENLGRKGFRVLSVDLNVWEEKKTERMDEMKDGFELQLSYLRFLYRKAPDEFLDNIRNSCENTGGSVILRIKGISEADCEGKTLRGDIKEMMERILSENLFDFIFLNSNRLHLAEGFLHELGVHGLLIGESIDENDSDTVGERLCQFYGRDEKLVVARILSGAEHAQNRKEGEIPCFSFQPEKLFVEERKMGGHLMGKRLKKSNVEKEDRSQEAVAPLSEFLIERWMKTEKLRRTC